MRIGNRYTIIGPTSLARFPLGVQPVGMKKAVIKPQAMNAPIFGMTIPAMKPPYRCIRSCIRDTSSGGIVLLSFKAYVITRACSFRSSLTCRAGKPDERRDVGDHLRAGRHDLDRVLSRHRRRPAGAKRPPAPRRIGEPAWTAKEGGDCPLLQGFSRPAGGLLRATGGNWRMNRSGVADGSGQECGQLAAKCSFASPGLIG